MGRRSRRVDWIVDAISTHGLSPHETVVLLVISEHADSKGVAFPGQRRIAELGNISRGHLPKLLDRLVSLHLLEIVERGSTSRSTRYRVPAEMPLPAPPIPLPTRRAEYTGRAWEVS